jgi:hypothetical protein
MAGRRSVEGITVSIGDDGEGGEISLEIPPTEETTATSEDIVDDDADDAADDFEEDLDMVELEEGFEELEKEKTDDSGEDVNNALKNLEESLNKIGMEQIVQKSKNNVKKLENFTNRITDKYTNILGAYDFKEAYGSTGGARRKRK